MRNNKELFSIILLGTLLGSNVVMARFSLGQYHPLTYNSLRLSIAALGYIAVNLIMPKRQLPKDPSLWLRAGIFGVFGLALSNTSFVLSLQYQSSGVVSLITTLIPVITILLAHVILKDEPLTKRRMLGAVIAFFGAGLIIIRGENGLAEIARADWRGYAWTGLGVFSASSGLVYARRFLKSDDAFQVATIRMITAAVVLFPIAWISAGFDLSHVKFSGYLALLYVAVAGTFFAFFLEFYIVKKYGASKSALSSYVVPVVATSLGVVILGEQVTLVIILGMVAIFCGLKLLN